jgi:hypothetical protein
MALGIIKLRSLCRGQPLLWLRRERSNGKVKVVSNPVKNLFDVGASHGGAVAALRNRNTLCPSSGSLSFNLSPGGCSHEKKSVGLEGISNTRCDRLKIRIEKCRFANEFQMGATVIVQLG